MCVTALATIRNVTAVMSATLSSSVARPPPAPLTPLVGREQETAAAGALLLDPATRLLTLTGPGGVGKTRLALQVLARVQAAFDDQVLFVTLASISDPALVAPVIARTLELREEGELPLLDRLVGVLRLRPLLLVLDNFEQVIEAAPFVAELLSGCPDLKVLSTSRIALRVEGEQEYLVPPLSLPAPADTTLEGALASEAVTLFVQRAHAARPDFRLTADNAPIVIQICRHLDGLPLAIELAAVRSKLLSPRALLARLEQRLEILTSGARNQPERLQTMRNAIRWSYSLLDPVLRQLFCQLSVFASGWTLDAAEAVVDTRLQHTLDGGLLGSLGQLVDHSLIVVVDQPDPFADFTLRHEGLRAGSEPRFRMLETIRAFGLEQLADTGEELAARSQHAAWCLALARASVHGIATSEAQGWVLRLELEHDNIRAALAWLIERRDAETAQSLVAPLRIFWHLHTHLSEARAWATRACAIGGSGETRAAALLTGAWFAWTQDDFDEAAALNAEALEIWEEAGDTTGIAHAHYLSALLDMELGDYDRATPLLEDAVAVFRQVDDRIWTPVALNSLGFASYQQGDAERAERYFEEALQIYRRIGGRWDEALPLTNLARIARNRGDYIAATRLYLAALDVHWRFGEKAGIAGALRGLATIAAIGGQPEGAARLFAAAAALRESIGVLLPATGRDSQDRAIATLRAAMPAATFAAAWESGRSLGVEQAVAEARALAEALVETAGATSTERDLPRQEGLTARELEVLRLLVEGLSDREIADALFIGQRTVSTHVANILGKLDLSTRTAAASYAVRHGLA
jgi:non-specific serine/threonine protein kinase